MATARRLPASSRTGDVDEMALTPKGCQSAPLFDDDLMLMTTMLAAVDNLLADPPLKMYQVMAVTIQ